MAEIATMDSLTRQDLRTLAETSLEGEPARVVSIFHPTDRVAPKPEQNSLHLKNALAEAERQLGDAGVRKPEADEILAPARRLLENGEFWQHQLDGLAVFCARGFFRYFRLPFRVDHVVRVGEALMITPLLPGLVEGNFYVLQISANQVRLLRGNRYRIGEVDISDLDIPRDLAEALRYDDLQKGETDHHVGTGPGRDAGPGLSAGTGVSRSGDHGRTFPGHGQEGDEQKAQLQQFFRLVDAGISKLLEADKAPLLLAAVDYYHPLYAEVTHNGHFLNDGIVGNYDHVNPSDLHAPAWKKVEPHLRAGLERAMERYRELDGTGRASCDLWEVVQAAYAGRVETLFLREGDRVWGMLDLEGQRLEAHEEPGEGDTDLLDLLCRQVILHAGDAYVLARDDMPCDAPAAGLYRY